MTDEPLETIELPGDDAADLARLYAEPDGDDTVEFNPILKIWREVLRPAAEERYSKVSPQWANRIVSQYPQMRYTDMELYRDRYFGHLVDLAEILNIEIASDPDCLTYTDMKDDAEHNAVHYMNLLLLWQMAVLQWEMDWECTAPDSAIEIAAISEVHKMFFGPTGMTQFLDNIGFEFTDDDSTLLMWTLEEFKGDAGE